MNVAVDVIFLLATATFLRSAMEKRGGGEYHLKITNLGLSSILAQLEARATHRILLATLGRALSYPTSFVRKVPTISYLLRLQEPYPVLRNVYTHIHTNRQTDICIIII